MDDFYIGIGKDSYWGGINSRVKDPKELPVGTAQDSLNWLTSPKHDHIELRGGLKRLGSTDNGAGKVTGLGVGVDNGGVQKLYFSYASTLKYYNATTDDTEEVKTNVLTTGEGVGSLGSKSYSYTLANITGTKIASNISVTATVAAGTEIFIDNGDGTLTSNFGGTGTIVYATGVLNITFSAVTTGAVTCSYRYSDSGLLTLANGEDVTIIPYGNIVGSWVYISSTNSSIWKINLANPKTVLDLVCPDVRGKFMIDNSKMFLWDIFNSTSKTFNRNSPDISYTDKQTYSLYTAVSSEVFGSGNGVTKTFTHTLVQVPGAGKQTAFAVQVTDGTETFIDDQNGNLNGNFGGTGKINYITGVVSVIFKTAPASASNNITCSYYYDTKAASIVDFSFSNPRTAGQGMNQPQYGGGFLQNIFPFNGIYYCFHTLKTWALQIGTPDASTTPITPEQVSNLSYRNNVGIPYWRAGYSIDDGVIYLDVMDDANPIFRMLKFNQMATSVLPFALIASGFDSDFPIDLTKNGLDFPVAGAFGNYYLFSLQSVKNGINNSSNDLSYWYNKEGDTYDKLDYGFSCWGSFNGDFVFGDSISNNVYVGFSRYDDENDIINNYWISGALGCGTEGLKRANRFLIDGYINPSQSFDIYAAYDHGNFTKIGSINGRDSYVDLSKGVSVGSDTVGLQVVGSGTTFNAFHFRNEFVIASDIFEFVTIKFVATSVGALQINHAAFRDLRWKGRRTLSNYET